MYRAITFQTTRLRAATSVICFGLFFSVPLQAASLLGSSAAFAVLGASAVTNIGSTTVLGDVGISPGTSITGSGSITLTGAYHTNDTAASQGEVDAMSAYNSLAAQAPTANLTGMDLGSMAPLPPGVYKFNSSAQLTGNLTLNAVTNPSGLFIFQIATTLTTGSNSSVTLLNGNSNSGVFWQVGSSATLGTGTAFAGSILANQSITLNTSSGITCGRAIALTGAVTMDTNTVSTNCAAQPSSSPVPEPGTADLMGASALALVWAVRRNRARS
jgi:hypothetical protein